MGHSSQELGSTQDISPGFILLVLCLEYLPATYYYPRTILAILATYLVLGKSYTTQVTGQPPSAHCEGSHYERIMQPPVSTGCPGVHPT